MPRGDCVWSAELFDAASRAANAERDKERVWNGQRIMWWSEWRVRNRREAVLILEDGARFVIKEQEEREESGDSALTSRSEATPLRAEP
jgi:hypothetical protein